MCYIWIYSKCKCVRKVVLSHCICELLRLIDWNVFKIVVNNIIVIIEKNGKMYDLIKIIWIKFVRWFVVRFNILVFNLIFKMSWVICLIVLIDRFKGY